MWIGEMKLSVLPNEQNRQSGKNANGHKTYSLEEV